MKSGFLQSISGNNSSSRLYGGAIILYAMLMTSGILACVFLIDKVTSGDIIAIAGAALGFFTSVTGAAMVFLVQQKKNEIKQEKNE